MVDNKRTIKFEIKVDADAKGADRFNRVLKELEASAPIADRELKKVRQGILDFVQATGASERSTKAAETALRTLQGEAKAGGPLWKQIGKDIATLKKELGEATGAIRSAEQAQKALNQALNAPVSNTFGKLAEQTGKLKAELTGLNYKTEQYLQTLVRVKELETVGSFNQGRLNTIAANQAFMGATLTRGYGASQNLPTLPDTLAGDSQRVSELTQRIQNLDRGSENYLQTVKELTAAQAQLAASQAQLNRAVDGGAASYQRINETTKRRDEKLRGIAEYGASGNIAERRNDGFGDRPQAQLRNDGVFIAPPFKDGNYTRMGDAGLGQLGAESPQDYQRRVEPLINAVESANEQVVTAKQDAARVRAEQEARIEARNQERIDVIAAESIKREKARFDDEIKTFDLQLEARDRKRRQSLERAERRRRAGREAGGIATAIGVGGFFGGFEGGAGAIIGGVIGGAGGAQTGATAGLGVASGRQYLGGLATQAADLAKLQAGLRGVAGSQVEYQSALQTIKRASEELNIPIAQGTQSMTQLTAAVKGAGGTVQDASLAFMAISSAIKATGGSTQDAEGAVRAITQIFSKGKVSAEELRGQLGERLPGAVTLFAQSLGMSGKELDKALEQGKVGLADLIKFLEQTYTRYGATARIIANSSDDLGARLAVQFNEVELAVGRALKPLGAEFQKSVIGFLAQNKDEIVASIQAITNAIKVLSQNSESISAFVGLATQLVIVKTSLTALTKLAPGVTALFTSIGAAGPAALTLTRLTTAVSGLVKAWVPTLVLTISIKGAEAYFELQKRIKGAQGYDGAQWEKDIGGSALTRDQLLKRRGEVLKQLGVGSVKANNSGNPDPLLTRFFGVPKEALNIFGLGQYPGGKSGLAKIEDENAVDKLARLNRMLAGAKSPAELTGSGSLKNSAAAEENKERLKLAEQLLNAIEQREEQLADARLDRERQIADARKAAIEQAKQLEKQFADDRLESERNLQRLRREATATTGDIDRLRRLQAGADPELIGLEQKLADASQQATEAKITAEQQIRDKEKAQAQTIADFQKQTAETLGKINSSYAQRIGEIQKGYAKQVGKIIEEGSGKGAKKLQTAAEIFSLLMQRSTFNLQRAQFGLQAIDYPVGKTPKGAPAYSLPADQIPPQIRKIDTQILDRYRNVNQSRLRQSIGDQFISMLGAQGGYEDVAGLQPLPIRRMQNQAARPLQMIWKKITDAMEGGYGLTEKEVQQKFQPSQKRNNYVIQRLQNVNRAVEAWNPLDAEWRERENRMRANRRSAETAIPRDSLISVIKQVIGSVKTANPQARGEYDLSDFLSDSQRKVLSKGLASYIDKLWMDSFAYPGNIGKSKIQQSTRFAEGLHSVDRQIGQLGSFFREFLESKKNQGYSYAEEALKRVAPKGAPILRFDREDRKLLERFDRLMDPPLITPGVESQFDGASIKQEIGDQFISLLSELNGFAQTAAASAVVQRIPYSQRVDTPPVRQAIPVQAFPAAQEATSARLQELEQQFRNIDLGTQKAVQEAFTQITADSESTLRSLKEQNAQFQEQQKLIREGVNPALAEQLGTLNLTYAKEVDRLNALKDLLVLQNKFGPEEERAYNVGITRAKDLLTQNKQITSELFTQNRQQEANNRLAQGIGSTLFNGINSAITSITSGTREWGDALREIASSVLADIGQQLVSAGLSRLLSPISMFGFSPFGGLFAEGGRPPLGKVSIVGEKGPELFVPDTAGTIVPNYKLAAALAPESMPQTAMGPIDVKVSTTVINGVEYATVDQLRVATRQAAERGQAMALNRLQRSTKTRKRVGV